MPPLPTGLVRDKDSGVYYHRRRIPEDLRSACGNRKEHIKSLRTSNYREAIQRFQQRDAKLLMSWEKIRQQRLDFFAKRQTEAAIVITEITPEVIDLISKHFEAASLNSDEIKRNDGHYDIELIEEYKAGYSAAIPILKAAVAVGDVDKLGPLLQQFLDLYNYEADLSESDFRRLAIAYGRAAIRTNEGLLRRYEGEDVAAPAVQYSQHKLFDVVADYIARFDSEKKQAMFSKVKTVLPLFKDIIGNKPVSMLRQTDIIYFLETIQSLPPRWKDHCRQKKISPLELASMQIGELSKKTYDDTYKAVMKPFLEWAGTYWQDRGFPTTLTTRSIKYSGTREESEMQQRAFHSNELKRLFMGKEMQVFARHVSTLHKFWLPHLALFTGARVNELCQLNPQIDIHHDQESGCWFLDITEKTDSDARIKKAVKTKTSKRKIPVHSKLIALGFLSYVKWVAKQSKLLFPGFMPSRGRAAPEAADWFIELMTDIDLRDETPGARLVGMHAFRSTFLNRAMNLGIVNAEAITGHSEKVTGLRTVQNGQVDGDASAIVRNYRGELGLKQKVEIVEKILFDEISFIEPVDPNSVPR